MSYATPQDMINEFGQREMQSIGDPDDTGTIDLVRVQNALDKASEQIDFAAGQRCALPLTLTTPSVQTFLQQLCLEIARYRLTGSSGITVTDEVRDRYKEADEKLSKIISGKIVLCEQTDDAQGLQPNNLTSGQAESECARRQLSPHGRDMREFRFGLENFNRMGRRNGW
jgi:phage gp36-like protein